MQPGFTADCRLVDAELDDQFGTGVPRFSEEAQGHIRGCRRCRALCDWFGESSAAAASATELERQIKLRLKRSLEPVRPCPAAATMAAQFFAAFLLFASPGIAVMGIAGLHQLRPAQMIGITAALGLGVALLSLSLAWQITPGSLHRIPAKAVLMLLTGGFVSGTALLFPWQASEAFLARGWPCLKLGLVAAIPAALMFWLLARRGAPLAMGTWGGTLGGFAGLLGVTMLQFTCSRQEAGHLLVWHGAVLVASIALGIAVAVLVTRLTRRRIGAVADAVRTDV